MNSAGVGSVLDEGVAERNKWRDAIGGTVIGDDARAALNVDVEGVHIDDETLIALSDMATNEHVRICALGAYQLSSCVGDKFLKAPYSDYPSTTDEDGKRTGKSARSFSSMPSIAVRKDLPREKTRNITEWQMSLLHVHSYAAISVHLNTLDDHVRVSFAFNSKYLPRRSSGRSHVCNRSAASARNAAMRRRRAHCYCASIVTRPITLIVCDRHSTKCLTKIGSARSAYERKWRRYVNARFA